MVVVVVLLLVLGGLLDRTAVSKPTSAYGALPVIPEASAADALSSTWFCAGAVGRALGIASGSLVVANAGSQALSGTVKLIASSGPSVQVPVRIAARAHVTMAETADPQAAAIAAVVNLDGGAATVEQVVTGPLGAAVSPCATDGSTVAYFATGTTLRDASVMVSILNPYAEPAIVDTSFTTEQGVEQPADFEGIVVPADSVISVDLASHLRRRYEIASTFTARSGRIVVFKTQTITAPPAGAALAGNTPPPLGDPSDPVPPVAGLTLALGAGTASTAMAWPGGGVEPGTTDKYWIYNPSGRAAHVELKFLLDVGSAEPVVLDVGPQDLVSVVANDLARLPVGVGYVTVLASTNGVPVVAERAVAVSAPASSTGLGELLGGAVAAKEWAFGLGATSVSTTSAGSSSPSTTVATAPSTTASTTTSTTAPAGTTTGSAVTTTGSTTAPAGTTTGSAVTTIGSTTAPASTTTAPATSGSATTTPGSATTTTSTTVAPVMAGPVQAGSTENIELYNPATATATVQVSELDSKRTRSLGTVEVPSGKRVVLKIRPSAAGTFIVVRSSQAVLAERDLSTPGARDISMSFGVPLVPGVGLRA